MSLKESRTRHDWARKVIHGEFCNKLKFDHTDKWYMHKPKSVQEIKMHKFHRDFEIQTYPSTWPDE